MKNSNDAMAFAIKAMGTDRVDKGGNPYVLHLCAVAHGTAFATQMNDEAVQAAILHDTVEDTDVTLADLSAAGFSDEVVRLVDALTKRDGEQPIDYWMRVIDAGEKARAIKAADAAHNSEGYRLNRVLDERDKRSCEFYWGLANLMAKAPKYGRDHIRQLLLENEARGRGLAH